MGKDVNYLPLNLIELNSRLNPDESTKLIDKIILLMDKQLPIIL